MKQIPLGPTSPPNATPLKPAPLSPEARRGLYGRLLSYVRPYWRIFGAGIAAMVVTAATEPAIPALLQPMLDGTFVDKDPFYIRWMPVALVLLFLVRGVSGFASSMALGWVGSRVVMDLRNLMFERILTLPVSFFDQNQAGSLISKLTYNVTQVTQAASTVLTVIVRDTLTVIGLIAWMLYLDWRLTLVSFIGAPGIAWVVTSINRRLRRRSRELQERYGELTHVTEEGIRGNRVVKVFGGEEYERRRFGEVSNAVRRLQMKVVAGAAVNVPTVQLVAALAMALIIWIAGESVHSGQVTVGGFMSFLTAMGLLFAPIKRLTGVTVHLQAGLAAAETIFQLLDVEPERDRGTRQVGRLRGDVVFEGVRFRYESSDREVLQGVDLHIRPGETVALVGPSGGGKSTIASLLPRFYNPSAGRITIDGIDTHEIALRDLRRQIALVSQEIVLFNDTAAANIAYGLNPPPSLERILEAARLANAREFIEGLSNGAETLLGDNAVRLSGGQRQRLAIARAILKDAPILILDEATAALDAQSEKLVQEALDTLRKGRSTLVIAHRLSTVESADRILVIDQGRIVEQGVHAELLALNGVYRRLYDADFTE